MSIWRYEGVVTSAEAILAGIDLSACAFCQSQMQLLEDKEVKVPPAHRSSSAERADGIDSFYRRRVVRTCNVCGWWNIKDLTKVKQFDPTAPKTPIKMEVKGAIGSLKELDLTDQSIPIQEIRSYLAARYSARFSVDPVKFEEVVASVYADLGYQTRVTARSGDDGIDIILDGPDDTLVGVQVKRSKNKIKVEQIRSLAGALYLNGLTRGVFVTTSTFQSGAERTANLAQMRGIPIQLIDAERFYDALGVAQREIYQAVSDLSLPSSLLPLISETSHGGSIWELNS